MNDLSISFFIPGEPVAKGRARSFIDSRTKKIGHFTPEKTVRYESTVALFGNRAMGSKEPTLNPVSLDLIIYFSVPSSWSALKQSEAINGLVAPSKKPDIDNCVKILCDGLNGIVWKDDVQVVDCNVKKRFSAIPGVQVEIKELNVKSCQSKKNIK